jgi:DNA-binding beta-propeller fold protein YncE
LKLLLEPSGSRHRLAFLAGAIAFVSFALLSIVGRAEASETIYWDNYGATPTTIGFANIDGTGGGVLNNASLQLPGTEVEINSPEGLAYDPANGRIYIANSSDDNILWVNTDGSGAGVLDTGAAVVEDPEGVAVDPTTQTVYWANSEITGSIGYASAGGGAGGMLNTTGASIEDPYKIALDTVNGRVYWIGEKGQVSYANLNGTGGADVPVPPTETITGWTAINVDPATNRLYVLGSNEEGAEGIIWLSTVGLGGGVIALEDEATHDDPYGLAFDPAKSRFYWANYGHGEEREAAFGTVTLAGGPATAITVATAPLHSPQDPVIVKSPSGAGAPQVTQNVAALSCSQGTWSQDYPGSFVYAAPLSYAYQWLSNGQAIAGATASSYTATAGGSYACQVTGKNLSGSASQTSSAVTVTSAALTATLLSKKPHAKAGRPAVVTLRLANGGQIGSAPVSVCATLTKQAKKGLVAPKCAPVAALGNGGSATATLRVKTKKSAKGTYKFTTQVKGATVAPVTVSVKVTAAKHKKKHHGKHHKKK